MSGKSAAPKKAASVKKSPVAKKAPVSVPESQLKKRKTVDALKAKQAAQKVRMQCTCEADEQQHAARRAHAVGSVLIDVTR